MLRTDFALDAKPASIAFCVGRFASAVERQQTFDAMRKNAAEKRTIPRPIRARLGAEIKRLRERQGLTLWGLADKFDSDAANVWRIEAGKQGVDMGMLYAIADALGVKMHQLLAVAEDEWKAAPAISETATAIALIWDDLPDPAKDQIEDRVIELMAVRKAVPTYFSKAAPRRQSWEEKFAALSRAPVTKTKRKAQ